MGLLRYAVFTSAIALLFHFAMDTFYTKFPLHFGGEVDSQYEGVQNAFEQNFIEGLEAEGASVAVYVKGRKVVDLWGGYADIQSAKTWKQNTISIVFSTTKAVAALCIAMLADRGRLKYDDLVSKHWPGFAKNGKENITIEWVLSQMAGLYYIETPITKEMVLDHNLMREVLENEAPKFPPGTMSGYHALSYGWLIDQIIRHTDEKQRGVGQFFREEIAEPHGIDFHIGLNTSEEYRVAHTSPIKTSAILKEIFHDYHVAVLLLSYFLTDKDTPMKKTNNPSWLLANESAMNNPEHHAMEQAAGLGIGNARSLAKMFSLVVSGKLISEKTMTLLSKPTINGTDYVIQLPLAYGHGFIYHPPIISEGSFIIGHGGYGCQEVNFDTTNEVVIAYVTNAMKAGMHDSCRTYARLQNAVYDVVRQSKT
ncbi:unnamed protein product [Cylicocyclus nassatus]|uniref:Beta-lactamase-related domain-containing protein n=1 Tax=Cylicocyclus nassatus TaxID=53992 RepID=A0AA36M9K0_CYLNA|nr:unnamed protein product [Cylicocyclus nassatus]